MLLLPKLARNRVLRVLLLLLPVIRRHVLEWLLLSLLNGSAVLGLRLILAVGQLGSVGVVGGGSSVGTDCDVVGAGLGEFLLLGEAAGVGVALAQAADECDGEEDGHECEDGDEGTGIGEGVASSHVGVAGEVVDGLFDEFEEGHEAEGGHDDGEHQECSLAWC